MTILLGLLLFVLLALLISSFAKTWGLPKKMSIAHILPSKHMIIARTLIVLGIVYLIWLISAKLNLFTETYADMATKSANEISSKAGNNIVSSPLSYEYTADPSNSTYLSSIQQNVNNSASSSNKANVSVQNFVVDNKLVNPNPVYYEPGTYKVKDSPGFVPTFEDIYKNQTTNLSQNTLIIDAPYISGGFCQRLAKEPINIETKCNELNKDICASTECCVLLGGAKCVAGNAQGPTNRTNYADVLVKDRNYYYHNGKCYGNCP